MHTSRLKLGIASVVAVAVSAVFIPGAPASSNPTASPAPTAATVAPTERAAGTLTSRVVGHFGRQGTARGHFAPDRFFYAPKRGQVMAHGLLTTTLRRGDGTLVGRTSRVVSLPVRTATNPGAAAAALATCDILHLNLGPLDLDLLGLVVHLDRVVLDITAESGAGNLLGNLLCAVAGLLDGPDSLLQLLNVANILNRILNLLG